MARKTGGLKVIPAQPQFRVIPDGQDVIYLPGESLYCASSQAALANFAVRVRCQLLCPQALPRTVITSVACYAPALGGLPLRLPAARSRLTAMKLGATDGRAAHCGGAYLGISAFGINRLQTNWVRYNNKGGPITGWVKRP